MNDKIKDYILEKLKEYGAFHWHSSVSSTYIKFKDVRLGSIRISDHKGRNKYKYTYEIFIEDIKNENLEECTIIQDIISKVISKSEKIKNFDSNSYYLYSNKHNDYVKVDDFEVYRYCILNKDTNVIDLINELKIKWKENNNFTFYEEV